MLKDDLRKHLLQSCPEYDLKRWYDPLGLERIESDRVLVVTFPHAFFSEWFTQNAQSLFERQVGAFLGSGYVMRYTCRNTASCGGKPGRFTHKTSIIDFPFGHKFTFDSFFVNEKNYFPLALSKEVSKKGEIKYNPFIICGASGTGKTHLLRAMANEIGRKKAKKNIFLGSVDDLKNIYTVKFPNDKYQARKFLSSFTWIFIDDFQNIKSHYDLEQELIILFNTFYDNKKQMVFCCADKFSKYDFLEPTLKSRLEWGLVVNLKTPDLDVRVRFVEDHVRRKKLPLAKDQIITLAKRFESIRSLRGALLKIDAFREHVKGDMSDGDFMKLIRRGDAKKAPEVTSEQILSVVSGHFQVPIKDLLGAKRHKNVVFARQVAMTLCRTLLGVSYPALGTIFGGKDHSTVLYSIRKINTLQASNKDTKNMLTALTKTCLQSGQS